MYMKNKIAVGIKYIETNIVHLNKNNKEICGDVSMCKRSSDSTTFILCDGIGSGIKANIAATMCVSRIYKSIEMGMSLFKICENIVSSMHLARTQDIPFAAFTIVRILNNGQFKVFTYVK